MKGKFDAYVRWPLAQNFQNWIVDRSTARDFTVYNLIDVNFHLKKDEKFWYKFSWQNPIPQLQVR